MKLISDVFVSYEDRLPLRILALPVSSIMRETFVGTAAHFLSENCDSPNAEINAIRRRKINETVSTTEIESGIRALVRESKKARALITRKINCHHISRQPTDGASVFAIVFSPLPDIARSEAITNDATSW